MDHNEISGYSTSKSIQNVTNNIEAFLRDSANVQNALEQSAKNNEEYFNSLEARIQATRKQIDELEHENRITNLKLNLIQSQIEEVGLEAIQLEEEALQLMMKNKTMKCQIASFQSILTEQQGHDWYQSESQVCINLLVKNVLPENVRMDIDKNMVTCTIANPGEESSQSSITFNLAHEIQPNKSTWKVLSSKIEIKLKKTEAIHWASLTADSSTSNIDVVKTYPTSLPQKKDWDRLANEIKKEEETEKLEGEAALNQLFQKIYAEGSDETKMAMNKSFMESGGTVLSTNWKDVGDKKIDVRPPDGMEWKKWE